MSDLTGVKVGDVLRSFAFAYSDPPGHTDTVARVNGRQVTTRTGVKFTLKKGLCITYPTYRFTFSGVREAINENV